MQTGKAECLPLGQKLPQQTVDLSNVKGLPLEPPGRGSP